MLRLAATSITFGITGLIATPIVVFFLVIQGGQPDYHQAYAGCMTSHGWKRIVVGSYRYG